jgi:hypothetical protein
MKCLGPDCGCELVSGRNRGALPSGTRRHQGRGLCRPCYDAHYRDGTHVDLPRITRRQDDVLDAWEIWRRRGYVRREVAAQLGMSLKAFERACTRARTASRTHADNQSACL